MRFRFLAAGLTAGLVTLAAPSAEAFCGFYVGKGSGKPQEPWYKRLWQ